MNKSIMMIKSFFLLAVLLIGVSPLVSASFHDERIVAAKIKNVSSLDGDSTRVYESLTLSSRPWLKKGDWIIEGMYRFQRTNYTKGYELSVFSSGNSLNGHIGISRMLTNQLGVRVSYESESITNQVKGDYQTFLFDSESIKVQNLKIESFIGTSLHSLSSSNNKAPFLYGGLGVGRRIENYSLTIHSKQSFKNLMFQYNFFVGIMQPINDKIALNLRLNRHLYTDTFFLKGIPNSIIMSETALKEWERDYELQFSIQFKF